MSYYPANMINSKDYKIYSLDGLIFYASHVIKTNSRERYKEYVNNSKEIENKHHYVSLMDPKTFPPELPIIDLDKENFQPIDLYGGFHEYAFKIYDDNKTKPLKIINQNNERQFISFVIQAKSEEDAKRLACIISGDFYYVGQVCSYVTTDNICVYKNTGERHTEREKEICKYYGKKNLKSEENVKKFYFYSRESTNVAVNYTNMSGESANIVVPANNLDEAWSKLKYKRCVFIGEV